MSEPKAYTLVTDSSGGIGEAFARALAAQGSAISLRIAKYLTGRQAIVCALCGWWKNRPMAQLRRRPEKTTGCNNVSRCFGWRARQDSNPRPPGS